MTPSATQAVSPSSLLGGVVRVPARPSGNENDPGEVGGRLLAYLGVPGLRFQQPPEPLEGGWETYTYGLRFRAQPVLPRPLRVPLVLRVYASPEGFPRALHEFAAQEWLHRRGFPVPRPLLLEGGTGVFGGPFLLAERVGGRTILETLRRRPWRLWDLPGLMATLHARLHALPAEGFPAAQTPFLPRRLDELDALINTYRLHGLWPGLDWLSLHRPRPAGARHVLHLDWHPLNIMYGDDGALTALDWNEADVGDRHADVAKALMMVRCLPAPVTHAHERLTLPLTRGVIARRYLRGYRRRLPLDRGRLVYYGAWAALHRLAGYGRWLDAGPASTGCKPSAREFLRPGHLADLCRYFRRLSGVSVRLG
jgi:aminoglycoside phosphotransferase (APT) family kinase protein